VGVPRSRCRSSLVAPHSVGERTYTPPSSASGGGDTNARDVSTSSGDNQPPSKEHRLVMGGCFSQLAGERRGAEPPRTVLPSAPAALSLPSTSHPSSPCPQRRVQLAGDSAGWVLGEEGHVLLGFACLAHLFCILPDVMFSLLCLF